MNKILIAIIFGIALISLASAETLIAGNCLSVDLSELESLDNVVYDVVGNSSNLEGLTINLNGTIANICTVPNYKSDSFTIIFIDNSTKEIIKDIHHYSSGRGSTKYVDRNTTIEKEVEKIVYVNQTFDEIEIEEPEEPIETGKKGWLLFGIFCGVIIILIIFFMGYWIAKKYKKEKKEDVQTELEKGV